MAARRARAPERARPLTEDLYEILEVSPTASAEVIRAAYHALARVWHPDVNGSADAKVRIQRLNEAYRIMSDPQKRAAYDLDRARLKRRERMIVEAANRASTTPAHQVSAVAPASGRVAVRDVDERPRAAQPIAAVVAAALLLLILGAIVAIGMSMGDEPLLTNGAPVEINLGQ